ncbi:MAG: hypothetical protein ACRC5M_04780 [Anaeroplasmataceae bacterium]
MGNLIFELIMFFSVMVSVIVYHGTYKGEYENELRSVEITLWVMLGIRLIATLSLLNPTISRAIMFWYTLVSVYAFIRFLFVWDIKTELIKKGENEFSSKVTTPLKKVVLNIAFLLWVVVSAIVVYY